MCPTRVAQVFFNVLDTLLGPLSAVDVPLLITTSAGGGTGGELVVYPIIGARGGESDLILFVGNGVLIPKMERRLDYW